MDYRPHDDEIAAASQGKNDKKLKNHEGPGNEGDHSLI
jgi:hypothetical protein